MSDEITRHDERMRRCPMLGHPLPFSYCRHPGTAVPCRKIFDCWWESFDIRAYIEKCYGEKKIAEILSPPKEKIASLAELVEQARKGN